MLVADCLTNQPHHLARNMLSSVGAANSAKLLIAELSHNKQAPFQGQRSKESAVWLFFQSPRSAQQSRQLNLAQPPSQLLPSAGTAACCSEGTAAAISSHSERLLTPEMGMKPICLMPSSHHVSFSLTFGPLTNVA